MIARHAYLEFADRLLPGTLTNALRRPLYQEHYSGLSIVPSAVDSRSIERLPLLDRASVQAQRAVMTLPDDGLCSTIFTGGTSGPALAVPVSAAERQFIRAFHSALDLVDAVSALPRRGLRLVSPFNGTHVVTPVSMRTHDIGIYDRGSFSHGRELLQTAQLDRDAQPRCTVLAGLERLLRAFTLDCEACGFPTRDSAVELVLSSGQQLTRNWRRRYCETWSAQLVDRYGLAEVYGGATEDPETGWYLFDPPCFAEVVNFFDGTRMDRGIGELVLTSLFPFQQAFPLIRYRTGDLVEMSTGVPGHEGCPAIKPLGRLDHACVIGRNVIPGAIFYEVFDDLADIARTDILVDAVQLRDRHMLGHPRYKVRTGETEQGGCITVTAEFASSLAPRDASGICAGLADGIRTEFERRLGSHWPDGLRIGVVPGSVEGADNPSYV